MMILDATNKSITAVLDAAAASTNQDYVCSYADITTSAFTPGNSNGTLNGATPVTIVSSPASSTQRQVKEICIYNTDTISHNITINYVDNASTRKLLTWLLNPGDSLNYTDERGFFVLNSSGAPVQNGSILLPSQFFGTYFNAGDITTVLTPTTATSYAVYLGKCPKVSTSVNIRYRVTTLTGSITYAEMAIFKGAINLGGNPTLTRLGYADISGTITSTGQKTTAVTLSTASAIGDELWAVIGISSASMGIFRAGLADDIASGVYATLAGRPSTVTSPTAWTVDSTTAMFWFKGFIM